MADEKWQQVREIFDSALRRQPEERRTFVNVACGEDKTLLAEVESLLSSLGSAENFMETPAVAKVADVIEAEAKKLESGRCFGHYEIVEQIGAGGMGKVYLARDQKLERRVAVKILNEKFNRDESNLQRFVSEAKAASALNHPNILTIYEIGESGDTHFIVSEFIKGKTLREMLKESPPPLAEVLDIAIQIANALVAAHEAHLVHRDIKPENIMIRPDGFVKILDFGLAKFVEQKNKSILGLEDSAAKQNETAKGVILGTINYMSPEQARGKNIDARTDIWSLGVVLYEMLTGKPPFLEETTGDTISAILNKTPAPLAAYVPDIPNELKRIVGKTLRKNREERYQHIEDLLIDLRDFKQESKFEAKPESSETPVKTDKTMAGRLSALTETQTQKIQPTLSAEYITTQFKSHKTKFVSALTVLLVATTTIGYYFLNRSQLNFQAGQITRLTSTGKTKLAAVSPDGKFVAHVQQAGENQSLWLRQIAAEGETQIIAPAKTEIRAVNFSPDGNLIYYIIGKTNFRGTLFQTSALGGQPKKVLENIYLANLGVNGIGFAPGGKQIAFVRLSPPPNETSFLMIADADGANERMLISYKRPDLLLGTPAWSPDGETIVCPLQNAVGTNALAIKVAQPDSAATVLPAELNAVSQIVWMPDGKNLLMVAEDDTETVLNQIYQVAYAGGAKRRVSKDFNNYESISLTADGDTLVAVRTEQTAHLWTMPANDASQLKQLTGGFEKYDGVNGLGWLPDSKIFYESMSGGKQAILQIDLNGGGGKQMVTDGGNGSASKDGRFLVYQKSGVKDNRLTRGLFLFDTIDGSERQLTTGWDIWATFSPDGKSINFVRWGEDAEMATLRSVPAEGGAPVHLTKFLTITADISPDGKSIAVARWARAKTQIVIVPASGGEPIKTFNVDFNIQDRFGKRAIQWTPDGRAVDFIRENKGVSNIWRQAIDGGDPLPVTNFISDLIFNFAFSPDGQQLALSRGTVSSDVVSIGNIR